MEAISSAARLANARRVVLKIGSALLVDAQSGFREAWLEALAVDIAMLRSAGKECIVVSSGSIALGRRILGLPQGELPLDRSQAAAAVGQIRLAQAYQNALAPHGITAAQILVTLDDSAVRRRYLNSRATIRALLEYGTVPIVNENDTVATDEIRFGDNDRLAAQIAALAGADLLVLFSDIDGLYTANPRTDPSAVHIPLVGQVTPEIEAMAGGTGSAGAKGGMRTKLTAARTAMQAGVSMVIARGEAMRPVSALMDGARSTWFVGGTDPATARKRWISSMKPLGSIVIDSGAVRALSSGKSLLPAGVISISGTFRRGDCVEIRDQAGASLAHGLVAYDHTDAAAIMGRKSTEIEAILGHPGRAALVHRDDLAM